MSIQLVFRGGVWISSVTLRKEEAGLGSDDEGPEPVAWTGTVGMVGVSS